MRTFYKRAVVAVVAGMGITLGGLLAAGPLAAQAQSNICIGAGVTGTGSGSTGTGTGSGSTGTGTGSGSTGTGTGSGTTGTGTGSGTTGTGTGSGTTGTGTVGPLLTITAPVATSSDAATGATSSTAPIDVIVGSDGGSSLTSMGSAPLATVFAPVNGGLITGNPSSDTTANSPLDVAVGQSSDPAAQGSLLAADAPVDASGTTAGEPVGTGTTLPLINVGQGSVGGLDGSSDAGPLVAANTPVNSNGSTAGVTVPSVNLGQGSNTLVGNTPGTGTLVNVSSPINTSTGSTTPSAAGNSVPLINLG
jgi:hypothetical protein